MMEFFLTKCCSYLLYAYNGALISTNQIQSHKTFLFHKLSRHVFLCIWNDTNPEKLHTKNYNYKRQKYTLI